MNLKKYQLWTYLAVLLFAAVYIFIEAPNLNPFFFAEGAMFWAVFTTVVVGIWLLFRFGELILFPGGVKEGARAFDYVPTKRFPMWAKVLLALPWVFILVVTLYSSVFFQWRAYRDQLGESQVTEFASDMQAIDLAQIPVVDKELAIILADKKIGERAGLGSQVRLGSEEATIQRIRGRLFWAVPLYHSGVFKWLTNLSGTPGYILVSATDVNDVEYVESHKIKYRPGNYLLHNLKRHARFHGGWFDGLAEEAFEISDDGQPYWVYTTYRNLRGFHLPEATGALIINAETGETRRYHKDNLPDWVDRIQPEEFIVRQIDNKGEYVRGWLNFADKDKFESSDGHMIVYNNDRCYLFTGLTSVGADDSTVGFILVDMVSKESFVYQIAGATEHAAQASAQGKVQHLGYYASYPLIMNVEGHPTYFMALKDKSRLNKQYAFVSVENYSIVGTGETMQEARKDYLQGLKNSGQLAVTTQTSQETAQGTVMRIASEQIGGETVYKLILQEQQKSIFLLEASLSDELALTREGDRVRIEYAGLGGIVQAASFDNLEFTQ